ncbi:FMN-binding protein [Flagellimonas aquimarina]|uniref:FMN-binding protein n=1 Tax=Flagellimonas aquimarina TaxID=2201895 RepID=A0A316L1R2_9FLAO|nr:FMN-binding protein [Allomuricauda koreensis]PWL40452.1 FMN-binding protein [Allomuricauda koreensis]
MRKANNFWKYKLAIVCIAFLFSSFAPKKISPLLQQKLNSAVQTTFAVEVFQLDMIQVDLGTDILFKINQENEFLGYAYLGKAPSMKDIFDYVVLFNPDLSIKKSKVLIYRENHGRQIGSQRWLKQFIGIGIGDTLDYGKDIDAISGATISAKSMTKAVEKMLGRLAVLKKEKVL